jgi:hypothetical protein
VALPAALLGFSGRDYFNDELVCIHVYNMNGDIPEPLLARYDMIPPRPKKGSYSLVDLCRNGDIEELIIIKNPARAPYLCSYPSLQKGFKKPPPCSAG